MRGQSSREILQMVRPRAAWAGFRNLAVAMLSVCSEICECLNEGKRIHWPQEFSDGKLRRGQSEPRSFEPENHLAN